MKFMTESGAAIDMALMDGYSVGDRLLEGVMFECRIGEDGIIRAVIQPDCANYFSGLNQKKWLDLVHKTINDANFDGFLNPDGTGDAWLETTDESNSFLAL